MSLNQKFTNYVAEKNIAEIRDWLWARLSTSFEMFEKEIKYCKSQGVDIYQPHDNRDVDLPATENSYNKLAGELKTNFSKERVNALIKIGRILYPKEEPKSIELHTTNTNTITHSSIEIEKKNQQEVQAGSSQCQESSCSCSESLPSYSYLSGSSGDSDPSRQTRPIGDEVSDSSRTEDSSRHTGIPDKKSASEPTDEADSKEESEDINNGVTTKKQEKSDSENYESYFSKNDCNSNTELQEDKNCCSNKKDLWHDLKDMHQI